MVRRSACPAFAMRAVGFAPAAASLVIAACRRSRGAGLILDPGRSKRLVERLPKCLPQIMGALLGVTEDTLVLALL